MNDRFPELESALREGLERRVADLDDLTLARLQAGRKVALAELDQPAGPAAWLARWLTPLWQPLPLAAAAALLLAVTMLPLQQQAPASSNPVLMSDAAILALDESLDLYDELDFYLWLEEDATLASSAMPE